jgi:Outer membrane protein beta-barrel domain
MFGKHFWIVGLTALTMLVASAVAQDEKNELGGTLGRTFISNQGIKNALFPNPIIAFGKGLSFDVEYGRRFIVTPIWSVSGEVVMMVNHDEDVNGGAYLFAVVPIEISELFVTPAVRLNLFPTTAVSPWVSVGGGFGHFSQSSILAYGGPNPGKNTSTGVLQGGFGLDVKVWRKLSMRGEVRDFWSGEPDFPLASTGKSRQHNYYVAGGVFWRF